MAITPVGGVCPNCGGNLEHEGKGVLVCPFCDGTFYDSGAEHAPRSAKRQAKPKTPNEIDTIIRNAIKHYKDPDGYGVHIGLLNDKMKKEDKVRHIFEINSGETLYMYYDETMFGSCKEGYALTNTGMHIHYQNLGNLFYPWDAFASIELKVEEEDKDLYVDGYKMSLTGNDGAYDTYLMLEEIKEKLYI